MSTTPRSDSDYRLKIYKTIREASIQNLYNMPGGNECFSCGEMNSQVITYGAWDDDALGTTFKVHVKCAVCDRSYQAEWRVNY